MNDDEGLRASLIASGYEQAKLFSEEAYRARLASVYDRFLLSRKERAARGTAKLEAASS